MVPPLCRWLAKNRDVDVQASRPSSATTRHLCLEPSTPIADEWSRTTSVEAQTKAAECISVTRRQAAQTGGMSGAARCRMTPSSSSHCLSRTWANTVRSSNPPWALRRDGAYNSRLDIKTSGSIRACSRQAKRGQEQPSPLSTNVARNWPSVRRAMQAKSPLAVEIFALGALKA